MSFSFGPRRGIYIDIARELKDREAPLSPTDLNHFEEFDLIYRCLAAVLYNYVPMSGHPGGSISSGRFVTGLLFDTMEYDLENPDRMDADIISYAAGHKALGLYAMWALRNEMARIAAPDLLPKERAQRLRLEDLLGFRRNPSNELPLFKAFQSKALDGHPTPATPFVKLSTGASGVGVSTSLGLALGARDTFGSQAPRVHIVEGEGGLTPGRVAEALAAAGTSGLSNAFIHLDWNQASIDSNRVCREGDDPGDYVQWNPQELAYLHDWNVVYVEDGKDFQQVMAAQRRAVELATTQPTMIVYRTIKGWQYGVEGRASHGAGHKLCSEGFFKALEPLTNGTRIKLPTCCDLESARCSGPGGHAVMEECLWESLGVIRRELEKRREMVEMFVGRLERSRQRLTARDRQPRADAPDLEAAYDAAQNCRGTIPEALKLPVGSRTTLRDALGLALNHYNAVSGGGFMICAADLLGSTSVNKIAKGFPEGFWHAESNPEARLLSIGGICEDAMSGVVSGLSTYGKHIGVASSYGAFLAPLGHISARLHAIGNQARRTIAPEPYKPMILVCAHAGLKTGEDGPTHADPQALQILQENFAPGTAMTLTPWEPQEVFPLVTEVLAIRPAVIAPFVTRPAETVPDREKLGLAPATACRTGMYLLRAAQGEGDGTLVLQGSGVALAFVEEVLPRLGRAGIDLNVYYVSSAELFDHLPGEQRERIFPEARARQAMGITGFTLPTLYRWIQSDRGREMSLYPFMKGHYLGSGQAEAVMAEAGLDGENQFRAIRKYVEAKVRN